MDRAFPYLNREVSWLDFNLRVLAMAGDEGVPLLERARFLAIHGSNLDEFFQVRVAGLKNLLESGIARLTPDGMSVTGQMAEIRNATQHQYSLIEEIFHGELVPALRDVGISYSHWSSLDDDDRAWLDAQFRDRIFPVLTPLAVDPAHPFPYISDRSLNLAVFLRHPHGGSQQFARVKVPPILPRFVLMPDGERFVPLEQVIARHLGSLFPGMSVVNHCPFRVTRDADLSIDDDQSDDLMKAIESQLAQRRFGEPVRLEIESHVNEEVRTFLTRELNLDDTDVYLVRGPLDMSGLSSLYGLDRPKLKYLPHTPQTPPAFARARDAGRSMFATLREHDVLVHHPYESFASSVEEFIGRACRDPQVLAIKMTMYRTSDDSSIVRSLIHAAENGKQVVVLVELQARFDEEANIEWARELERAGVHVGYGLVGLKTHSKTALIVREEGDVIRRYGHIGTGNYNSDTARAYEDIGLFTADPEIGADLSELFNGLTGYSARYSYQKLVVAPHSVRASILALIDIESHYDDGEIVLKMNSLVDAAIIEALYEASKLGTKIELIVRGTCCLVPGLSGISENITVRSIVGRYLEHSRIYRFGSKRRGHTYLIGSADLMPRNLDGRVEALIPVNDPSHIERLDRIIDQYLADDQLAWELDNNGNWWHIAGPNGNNVQLMLEASATRRTNNLIRDSAHTPPSPNGARPEVSHPPRNV